MDEAANRAYDITARHLQDHIVHLETAALGMAEAVDRYSTKYEDLVLQYRVAQTEKGGPDAVLSPASHASVSFPPAMAEAD